MKQYWFILLGKEIYSYKKKGDQKHKDMQSLTGVFIKTCESEQTELGVLHPFMLIFSNKRRIYYLESAE